MKKITDKQLDLLKAYNRTNETTVDLSFLKYFIAPSAIIIAIIAVVSFNGIQTGNKNKKINSLQDELDQVNYLISAIDSEAYQQSLLYESEYNYLLDVDGNYLNSPKITEDKIKFIYSVLDNSMNVLDISYNQSAAIISVSINTDSILAIEEFISKLKANESFYAVDYSSYGLTGSETKSWNFSVAIRIGEGEVE